MKKLNKKEMQKFMKKSDSAASLIKCIFCYFRGHLYLLENGAYKCLYEELIAFLLEDAGWENNKQNREWIEFIYDSKNKGSINLYEKYVKSLTAELLEHRTKK